MEAWFLVTASWTFTDNTNETYGYDSVGEHSSKAQRGRMSPYGQHTDMAGDSFVYRRDKIVRSRHSVVSSA